MKNTSPYCADLHIHTTYCGHARGTLNEMVQSAISHGFSEIGFADHFPYPDRFIAPVPNCVIPEKIFPQFISEVMKLQEEYNGKINIRLAAEIDYLPDYINQTKKKIQLFPFDYIMGSVHIIEGMQIDYSEEMLVEHLEQLGGVNELWRKYWQHIEELIRSEIGDIIAHFDLPKKYGVSLPLQDYSDCVDHLLNLIKDRNCVLEINTGGIDRSFHGESYPSLDIIRMARKKDMDITLGSDAHRPEEIGRHFNTTREFLRSLGWEYAVVFQNRERIYKPL
ncbi:histidinol-phosphatase HisJ [bacterium]|nr:histidinol-phosphatase HisJ [bacterium]